MYENMTREDLSIALENSTHEYNEINQELSELILTQSSILNQQLEVVSQNIENLNALKALEKKLEEKLEEKQCLVQENDNEEFKGIIHHLIKPFPFRIKL